MSVYDPLKTIQNPTQNDMNFAGQNMLNSIKNAINYKEKNTFFNKLSKLSTGEPIQTQQGNLITALNFVGNNIVDKFNNKDNQEYLDYWMRTYNSPGVLVDPNKYGDIQALKYGGQIRKTADEMENGEHNIVAEKNEMVFGSGAERNPFEEDSAIGGGLYHIDGKSHAKGGTPIKLSNNDFVFSQDKSMAIPQDIAKDIVGKDIKDPKKRTPAALAKHYDKLNDFIALSQDKTATDLQRKTALLNVENFTKQLGQISAAQEMLKGLPDGIPDLTERGIQTAKRGGKFIPRYDLGGPFDDNPYPYQPKGFSDVVNKNPDIKKYLFNYFDNNGEIADIQHKGKNSLYGGVDPSAFNTFFNGVNLKDQKSFKLAQQNFEKQYQLEHKLIGDNQLIPQDIFKYIPNSQFNDDMAVSKFDGNPGQYSANRFSPQIIVNTDRFKSRLGVDLTEEDIKDISAQTGVSPDIIRQLKLTNFIGDAYNTNPKPVSNIVPSPQPNLNNIKINPPAFIDKNKEAEKDKENQTRSYNPQVNMLPNELLAMYYNNKTYEKRYPTAQRAYELENVDSLLNAGYKDLSYRPYLDETQRQINNLDALGDSPQSTARQLEAFKQGLNSNNKAISDVTNANEQRRLGLNQTLAANQGTKAQSRIALQKQYINEIEQLRTNLENEKKQRGVANVKSLNEFQTRKFSQQYLNAMADNFQLDANANLKLIPQSVRKQIENTTGGGNTTATNLRTLVNAIQGLDKNQLEVLASLNGGAIKALIGSSGQ